MAWTSRDLRFKAVSSKEGTGERLGPGAYLGHRAQEASHGYAPFGSTKARMTTEGEIGAPVGAYDPKLPGGFDSGLPKKEVGFGSTEVRGFAPSAKEQLPGPGQYSVMQKSQAAQASRTMGEPQRETRSVFRSSSAPSIPQSHQSFGYEEVGNGRLSRQVGQDAHRALTGRNDDSAGPGQYEVPNLVGTGHSQVARRTIGGNFLGGSRPSPMVPSDVPGPGHYVPNAEMRGNIAKAPTVLSSFASQAERMPSASKKRETPGPGQYEGSRLQNPSLREQHAELQYFGSTVERFQDIKQSKLPGPGSYLEQPRRMKPAIKPFCSSTGRFQVSSQKAEATPGPGSYDAALESSTTGKLGTVSILGAMGGLAFGSMERRGGTSLKSTEIPGPGAYQAGGGNSEALTDSEVGPGSNDRRGAVRRRTAPSSVFKSATPKDVVTRGTTKAKNEMPAPGAYDPLHTKETTSVVRMPPRGEGFLSAGPRFTYVAKEKAEPGPGNYDPVEVTGGKRMASFNRTVIEGVPQSGRPKGLGFASQDARFQGGGKKQPWKKSPGPGEYEVGDGWITKTYNVYFGDLP
eukprot:TRINITY_DN31742_c0_g2_i1.p1 TRINITY_DN31742_c0_g2~~TRINITY_DN31742_c0_g2_i1.p1  ORF type:complete len:573 (-),score=83.60 TRINITY_DN31742_c0_g2_i1:64-1782(-)